MRSALEKGKVEIAIVSKKTTNNVIWVNSKLAAKNVSGPIVKNFTI